MPASDTGQAHSIGKYVLNMQSLLCFISNIISILLWKSYLTGIQLGEQESFFQKLMNSLSCPSPVSGCCPLDTAASGGPGWPKQWWLHPGCCLWGLPVLHVLAYSLSHSHTGSTQKGSNTPSLSLNLPLTRHPRDATHIARTESSWASVYGSLAWGHCSKALGSSRKHLSASYIQVGGGRSPHGPLLSRIETTHELSSLWAQGLWLSIATPFLHCSLLGSKWPYLFLFLFFYLCT